jgi:hypothetical protein
MSCTNRLQSRHAQTARCADNHPSKDGILLDPDCVHVPIVLPHVQDVSPQQDPGAQHCTADDSQLTQPADSQSEEVSTAAAVSDAHCCRKRKAEAWLQEETAGDMRKQPTCTSSALDCAATCCPGWHATFYFRGLRHAWALNVLCIQQCNNSHQQRTGSVVWATMGKKKWPALVLDADVVKVWLKMHLMRMQVGNARQNTEACGDMLAAVQAGDEQLHARVQLFATGIKTTVQQANCSPFHSTDASADDSALAHKVCDSAKFPYVVAMERVRKLVLMWGWLPIANCSLLHMPNLCRRLQEHECTSEACVRKNSVLAVRPALPFMWSVKH